MLERLGPVPAWLAALLLVALGLLPALAGAQADASLSAAKAQAWLSRIGAAANEGSYRGTMVFSAGGVVSSSRVAHFCDGRQFVERVEALDGRQHRVYRHNHVVRTVWPQERVVVIEQRDAPAGLVSIRRSVDERALQSYEIHAQGHKRVAGRTAQVLMLQPLDSLRYAQRLWADLETGLLLRTDVLDADARVLESSAFSEIDFGSKVSASSLLEGMQPQGYLELPSPNRVVELAAEGWRLRGVVPGFELMGCLKRELQGGERGHRLQAVFSDGLSFVSVFVEPFDPRRHAQALSAGLGATGTLMRREGPHWVTAMGDVPVATLERFLSLLERRP